MGNAWKHASDIVVSREIIADAAGINDFINSLCVAPELAAKMRPVTAAEYLHACEPGSMR